MKENDGKKRLWIFVAIAYGITALMMIPMLIGLKSGMDLTVFVSAQMLYPACGVILGKLITRQAGEKLPMVGYITVLVTTAVLIVMSFLSICMDLGELDLGALGTISMWNYISQFPLLVGSLVAFVAFIACGREKRENAGLLHRNVSMSILMVVLFVCLYFARVSILSGISGLQDGTGIGAAFGWISEIAGNPAALAVIANLPFSYFFAMIAFFGEEYGWRYYLQPILQKKFGLRGGVLVLGVVWAIWHIGADCMYYTKDSGFIMFLAQIVTCLGLGVFFGYAYMKTRNIWVPVVLHYLNNNLVPVLAGGRMDALQNQQITWGYLPYHILGTLVFFLFILAPIYGPFRKRQETEL